MFMFTRVESSRDVQDCTLWIGVGLFEVGTRFGEEGEVEGVDAGVKVGFGGVGLKVDVFAVPSLASEMIDKSTSMCHV